MPACYAHTLAPLICMIRSHCLMLMHLVHLQACNLWAGNRGKPADFTEDRECADRAKQQAQDASRHLGMRRDVIAAFSNKGLSGATPRQVLKAERRRHQRGFCAALQQSCQLEFTRLSSITELTSEVASASSGVRNWHFCVLYGCRGEKTEQWHEYACQLMEQYKSPQNALLPVSEFCVKYERAWLKHTRTSLCGNGVLPRTLSVAGAPPIRL